TVFVCRFPENQSDESDDDGEEHSSRLQELYECCVRIIEALDGVVVSGIGHKLAAAFGYPLAHEDDAQRAVHTELRVLDAMHRLPASPSLGIDSGLVQLETHGDGQVSLRGDPVSLAELLADQPGLMVVSTATHRLVNAFFATVPLGDQRFE